ncbi:MAG: HAD hydrolase-like protein, partial [Candidatus Cloacimonetes bacterium]|nr:HAD hydrolase-like protein [Candidatus Cloacimonadota bacterium]
MTKSIKAVIFDLDGTLVDTLEDIHDAMNKALSSFGFAPHSLENYCYLVGNGVRDIAHDALPESSRDNDQIDRL